MTMHFNDFELPSALEDELAGCPVRKRIDAVCTEPGCPNNGLNAVLQQRIQLEDCIRVDDPPSTLLRAGPAAARPLWRRMLPGPARQGPADIYQTQPKDRCVM
jgi:hypothetical protein